jgi:hypothetical protein
MIEPYIFWFFAGILLTYLGYGPLSLRKHPGRGAGFAVVGFLCRLVGPPAIAIGLFVLVSLLFIQFH